MSGGLQEENVKAAMTEITRVAERFDVSIYSVLTRRHEIGTHVNAYAASLGLPRGKNDVMTMLVALFNLADLQVKLWGKIEEAKWAALTAEGAIPDEVRRLKREAESLPGDIQSVLNGLGNTTEFTGVQPWGTNKNMKST